MFHSYIQKGGIWQRYDRETKLSWVFNPLYGVILTGSFPTPPHHHFVHIQNDGTKYPLVESVFKWNTIVHNGEQIPHFKTHIFLKKNGKILLE